MEGYLYDQEPRPQELVAEIFKQLSAFQSRGQKPVKVFLSPRYIRRLRIYHALLGQTSDPQNDYMERNAIFGLEFFVGGDTEVRVSD